MKIVTKRKKEAPPLEDARILLRTIGQLRGHALVPKGVQRFRSFQEAKQWMDQQMINTLAHQKLKT